MKYLTAAEVIYLHDRLIAATGGATGIINFDAIEAAVAQPRMAFEGQDLYPTAEAKAAALGFGLIKNHAFVDGNKRIGHAAMEAFLMLNGLELRADLDDAEVVIVAVAAGRMSREEFQDWVTRHVGATG